MTIMSGVGFMTAMKTFGPANRRRRRCEKQQRVLELPGYGREQQQPPPPPPPDVVPSCWDAAPPITPPAAFLPPGYKKGFGPGESRWWCDDDEAVGPRERKRGRLSEIKEM